MSVLPRCRTIARAVRTWAAVAGLTLGGCASDPEHGYAFAPAWPAGITTVAVPVFANETFYHGLEVHLTEAVVRELQQRTPWAVSNGGGAQTTLRGTITRVDKRPLTLSRRTGLVLEQAVTVTVDFEWRHADGRVLAARQNLTATEAFVPARPTGEPLALAQHAVVQELAREIVHCMRSSW